MNRTKVLPLLGILLWLTAIGFIWHQARIGDWSAGESVFTVIGFSVILAIPFVRYFEKLFGPVFLFEASRLGRKRLTYFLRTAYALVLLGMVGLVFLDAELNNEKRTVRSMANLATEFFEGFMMVQFAVVCFLAPLYTATAITDEKERKTIEFLFATDLGDLEILFGKMAARLLLLTMFIFAGLPVLALLQMFGGIDPERLIAGTAATLITLAAIAAIGMTYSVLMKRSRDAIMITYLTAFLYVVISAIITTLVRFGYPAWYGHELTLLDYPVHEITDWLSAGNVVYVVPKLMVSAGRGGFTLDPSLMVNALFRYGIFWLVAIGLMLLFCALRLRRISLHSSAAASKRGWLSWLRRSKTRILPRVTDQPMTWKEVYVERGHLGLPGKIIGILVIVMLLFPLVPMTYFELYLEGHVKAYREEVNVWVRIATGMFATMAYFSACLRGAASITSEKDRDTWTNLVSSGLSAGEILWGKWWGSMRAPRSLYRVIIFCWLFATLVGAVNVLMLFATALTMSIHLAAYSWLGMLCSVNARTTMIASVRAFLAAIFVSGGFWIVFACCGSIVSTLLPRSPFQSGFLEDIVTIPVACTPPFIVGWMPHPWETLHRDWAPFDDQRVVYLFIGIGIWILFAWILKFWVEKKFLAATNRKHLDD